MAFGKLLGVLKLRNGLYHLVIELASMCSKIASENDTHLPIVSSDIVNCLVDFSLEKSEAEYWDQRVVSINLGSCIQWGRHYLSNWKVHNFQKEVEKFTFTPSNDRNCVNSASFLGRLKPGTSANAAFLILRFEICRWNPNGNPRYHSVLILRIGISDSWLLP